MAISVSRFSRRPTELHRASVGQTSFAYPASWPSFCRPGESSQPGGGSAGGERLSTTAGHTSLTYGFGRSTQLAR